MAPQSSRELLVGVFEAEEHFIGLPTTADLPALVRLEEVQVVVAWRLGGAALVRSPKEQVTEATDPGAPGTPAYFFEGS